MLCQETSNTAAVVALVSVPAPNAAVAATFVSSVSSAAISEWENENNHIHQNETRTLSPSALDFSYTNTNYICMSIHPGQCMNEQPYPAKSSTTRKALWRYFHSLLRQHDASVAPDDEVKSVDKGYMTRLSTVSRFIKKFDTRNLARTCWEAF